MNTKHTVEHMELAGGLRAMIRSYTKVLGGTAYEVRVARDGVMLGQAFFATAQWAREWAQGFEAGAIIA